MKKFYQIFNNWDLNQVNTLKLHEINVEQGFQNIRLSEEDYIRLYNLFKEWKVMVTIGSDFSAEDLSNASTLMILPRWQTSYPYPESKLKYLNAIYDLSLYCFICGTGAIQRKPFRIKNEPKLEKKKSFILNWVLDEIFVSRAVYENIFLRHKIECLPVLLGKNDKVIENIVQLIINKSAERLNTDVAEFTHCKGCQRKKYTPITNGFFPKLTSEAYDFGILKSQEYYGSGKSASHWILLSQSLRKKLVSEKMDFTYYPSGPFNKPRPV